MIFSWGRDFQVDILTLILYCPVHVLLTHCIIWLRFLLTAISSNLRLTLSSHLLTSLLALEDRDWTAERDLGACGHLPPPSWLGLSPGPQCWEKGGTENDSGRAPGWGEEVPALAGPSGREWRPHRLLLQ